MAPAFACNKEKKLYYEGEERSGHKQLFETCFSFMALYILVITGKEFTLYSIQFGFSIVIIITGKEREIVFLNPRTRNET